MESDPDPLMPVLAALRDLIAWWRHERVIGMIIGGVAASILGRPRATRDVDGVIWLDEIRWPEFLLAGERFSFIPRLQDALNFASEARILLLRHKPSQIDVDISLGSLPFEREALARALSVKISGIVLPVTTPEDLIVMKAIARRPRDVADIEAVMDSQATLDLRYVKRWVRNFASMLEMPEIVEELERQIAALRKRKKRKKKP